MNRTIVCLHDALFVVCLVVDARAVYVITCREPHNLVKLAKHF